MEQFILEEFSCAVEEVMRRNVSFFDVITKLETSNAKMSRAAAKAITQCGCVHFEPKEKKKREATLKERSGVRGEMCDSCREELEKAVGEHLFYLSGFLSITGLNFYDVYLKEMSRQRTLGKYSLR